jgi:predicted DNA-binding protein
MYQQTQWVQLPVRIELTQSRRLDHFAKLTRIPKSEIVRSSITSFLNELESSGVKRALENIHGK